MKHLVRFILQHAILISILGTLLGFVGTYYTVLLYKNLRTDIEELLPTTARSITDLNEVTSRLEAIDNIVVVTLSKDKEASRRFVTDLAARLGESPKTVISSVEYRIDREVKFFSDRRALLIDLKDLERVRDYIRNRISYETELRNPLNIFSQNDLYEPRYDFKGLIQKYDQQASAYSKFPDGFYATPDESVRIVIAYMPGKGIEAAHRLRAAIDEAIAALNPGSYAPDLEVKFTGNIQNMLEENSGLIADIETSTLIVLVLVTLAMFLFYRSFLPTLALVWSLFMGTFWTFGISYFAVGYLNANSAFLASIVIGNGINFGIIFLARYLEERRLGHDNAAAITTAMHKTATSTWTAALAAGFSYGSLILTEFRGFKQFGVIGLIGMVLCWVSAYTLLPAYLTTLDRLRKSGKTIYKSRKPYFTGWVASLVDSYPKALWGLALFLIISSLFTFRNLKDDIIEVDLTKLRNKASIEHGSGYNEHYIDEVFQHGLSPMVVLPRNRDDARKITTAFRNQKEEEGPGTIFTTIQDLDDFIPPDQAKKIRILKDIRLLLPPQLTVKLSAPDKKLVSEFLNPKALVPITEKNLPPMILNKFREHDGSIGKMVLVDKIMGKGTDRIDIQIPFIRKIRRIADSIAPGTPIAGQLPVTADMLEAVIRDGPRATLFAFLSVVVLVAFLFHNVRIIAQVLFALCVGVTWLAGIILGFHLKINFLNFIALPITFGIGVDYGVNVFQRYREEGQGSILSVIRNTGGAVMLSSLTTMIGYSSLLIAGNQAIVSFGRLAVLGELTCITAAVIAMPAFLRYLECRRSGLTRAGDPSK